MTNAKCGDSIIDMCGTHLYFLHVHMQCISVCVCQCNCMCISIGINVCISICIRQLYMPLNVQVYLHVFTCIYVLM